MTIVRDKSKTDPCWVTPVSDKYYVYAYFDEMGLPFYIGKGKGHRVNNHTKPSLLKEKSHKNHKIKQLLKTQGYVKREIISYFESELAALEFESWLISCYGLKSNGGLLCNLMKSHWDMPDHVLDKARRGSSFKLASFSRETAENILCDYKSSKITQKALSEKYNLPESTLNAFLTGKTKVYSDLVPPYVKKKPKFDCDLDKQKQIVDSYYLDGCKTTMSKFSISKTHLYRLVKKFNNPDNTA